jgi:hypothetical protein
MTVCVRAPGIVVVVVLPGTVVVVVVGSGQEPWLQASQQLGAVPTQAPPPLGALHLLALALIAHLVTPFAFVRQQVTEPAGFPQVDLAAQATTAPLQLFGSSPPATAALATPATHLTYCPWFVAAAQGQRASAAARTAATAAGSTHGAAWARCTPSAVSTTIATTRSTPGTLRSMMVARPRSGYTGSFPSAPRRC